DVINVHAPNHLREGRLAEMMLEMVYDDQYATQIARFYADCTPEEQLAFMDRHGLPERLMEEYYEMFVKS
ncbi:MAG: hypothetical protein NUV35_08410, partial [Syntrophomonadaceae bacterium]|nr:hypothetical protein [Syntrophomonadaceae bacterium]